MRSSNCGGVLGYGLSARWHSGLARCRLVWLRTVCGASRSNRRLQRSAGRGRAANTAPVRVPCCMLQRCASMSRVACGIPCALSCMSSVLCVAFVSCSVMLYEHVACHVSCCQLSWQCCMPHVIRHASCHDGMSACSVSRRASRCPVVSCISHVMSHGVSAPASSSA